MPTFITNFYNKLSKAVGQHPYRTKAAISFFGFASQEALYGALYAVGVNKLTPEVFKEIIQYCPGFIVFLEEALKQVGPAQQAMLEKGILEAGSAGLSYLSQKLAIGLIICFSIKSGIELVKEWAHLAVDNTPQQNQELQSVVIQQNDDNQNLGERQSLIPRV